jgi:hypothetical protein
MQLHASRVCCVLWAAAALQVALTVETKVLNRAFFLLGLHVHLNFCAAVAAVRTWASCCSLWRANDSICGCGCIVLQLPAMTCDCTLNLQAVNF